MPETDRHAYLQADSLHRLVRWLVVETACSGDADEAADLTQLAHSKVGG